MQATNTKYMNTETGTFILFEQTKMTKKHNNMQENPTV